jgi:putative nucleotidyltransferase with HDIG domain
VSGAPDPLALARAALAGQEAHLVGGAIRDRLLGRAAPPLDVDLIVADPERAAQALRAAAPAGTAAFALSDAFGAWRVVGPRQAWQVDCSALQGATLEDDLRARDLTVNAIAEPLAGGAPIDPTGGLGDLAARRLRMVRPEAFAADPLRVLRVARLAVELDLEPDEPTLAAAREHAPGLARVSGERTFAELRRTVGADRALDGLALLEATGATAAVLPELLELRGVEQTVYHHKDAHDHTLEVLEHTIALQADPAAVLGDAGLGARAAAVLAEPLADELTRGDALRWGALLHDIAKPITQTDFGEGRIGFPHHDREGARMSREILTRLRASERLRAHVAALALHHLRLGFLVHERPLGRRQVHRYLVLTEPVPVDVTLLSITDRLATRGRKHDEAIARHLEVGLPMLDAALAWHEHGPPPPLIRGDALAAALDLAPGPRLGELLAGIAEAQYAGEATTPEQAVDVARRMLLGEAESR